MLYMKGSGNDLRVIVLETGNLEELKKGRPAVTPDREVLICWTPDPEWLAEQILESGGDPALISKAIAEASKRPQKPTRPYHETRQHHLGGAP